MNAENWMALGARATGRGLIPPTCQPTLPLLARWQRGYRLWFFYCDTRTEGGRVRLESPSYRLAFDEGGAPAGIEALSPSGPFDGGEALTARYAARQRAYMAELDDLLDWASLDGLEDGPGAIPDEALAALKALWLDAHPRALRPALESLTREM